MWSSRRVTKQEMRRLMHGGGWSLFGGIGSRAITLLATVLIVRILGASDFSRFAIVQSTLVTALAFAGYGAGLAATKYGSQYCQSDPIRLGRVLAVLRLTALIIGLVAAAAISLGAGFIATHALGDASIQPLILVGAVAIVFGTLDAYQTGALVGFEAMRSSALAMTLSVSLGVMITVGLSLLAGARGAVIGLVITYVLQFIASGLLLRAECRRRGVAITVRGCQPDFWMALNFAAPSMLSGLMVAPAHWLVQASLLRHYPGGVQLTVLAVALQWFYAIAFVPQFAGRILLPVLSDVYSQGRSIESVSIMKAAMLAYSLVVIPVSLLVALGANWIMLFYGHATAGEGSALGVTALAAALASICIPVGQVIAAHDRMWIGFVANLMWAVVFVSVSTTLLGEGALGVAWALLIAYAVQLGVSLVIVRQRQQATQAG